MMRFVYDLHCIVPSAFFPPIVSAESDLISERCADLHKRLMNDKLKLNFVMPPCPKISGGPLAILEYASRFIERGHTVSITTYPDTMWGGTNPFPWFDFKGPIYYKRLRNEPAREPTISVESLRTIADNDYKTLADTIMGNFGLHGLREIILRSCENIPDKRPVDFLVQEIITCLQTIDIMPECDLNIATLWATALPVYLSQKGKPVYFMQHYEEIFYPLQPAYMMHRLAARLSYALPMFKVANSSWLQRVIRERTGQSIPFSNNGLILSDFAPGPKLSSADGVIRIFTYSRPDEWKGFGDAVAAISRVRARYGARIEWNVFGYRHPDLPEDNPFAKYTYHPRLSFRELAHLYAISDIVLCPSWYESFPLPPLEAMASGTAVVTTGYGTEDYAVHEQNALVVGSRDIEGMVVALSRLIEDDTLRNRLAVAGRHTAQEFTWDRAVELRENILLDIHRGSVQYDVLASAKLGLADSWGLEFERAPRDLVIPESAICCKNGNLFLIHGGVRHHVMSPDIIPALLKGSVQYIELDNLTMARIPMGLPISKLADVPAL